ncbi:hypothetical protein TWF694_008014 [Orbilia ellipsospora]|uniref:DJ-1/PfpI domain-containing protein n=1 Tax=Orbilia ellipsospora TaxID=2528407 RepID=A0AAV9XFG9_9PEZI
MKNILTIILGFCTAFAVANVDPQPGPKPKNIGIALFRAWQPMDVFGVFEALWELGLLTPINVYLIDADGSAAMVKPFNPFATGSNTTATVLADYSFDNAPPLDVWIVGGGIGTRDNATMAPVIEFTKKVYPSLQYMISVCTGASVLARAGILDGKRATTNKNAWAFVTQFGQRIRWQPHMRYVRDGNVWTTSGVSAGVDGILGWIEYVWGTNVSTTVTNAMEWYHSGANDDIFGTLHGL